jgi:hypothetical protein
MDLKELGVECVDWIHLAQDRDRWLDLVNPVMNFRGSIKGVEFLDLAKRTISFSRNILLQETSYLVSAARRIIMSIACLPLI